MKDNKKYIRIKGQENNLKASVLNIPRDSFIVMTGLSGQVSHLWHLKQYTQKDKEVYGITIFLRKTVLGQVDKPDVENMVCLQLYQLIKSTNVIRVLL